MLIQFVWAGSDCAIQPGAVSGIMPSAEPISATAPRHHVPVVGHIHHRRALILLTCGYKQTTWGFELELARGSNFGVCILVLVIGFWLV